MPRICQEIDQQVQPFLSRPLQESGHACVYLDATAGSICLTRPVCLFACRPMPSIAPSG
ncbi:MAG: hypothetical protein VKJ05_07820 [Synechococcaceae cyanobacterium]|nr:hypothetical protein [Synechococcaceae cyanobacterium]